MLILAIKHLEKNHDHICYNMSRRQCVVSATSEVFCSIFFFNSELINALSAQYYKP